MKTTLCALLLIAALPHASGQGTVRFSNGSYDLYSPPDRLVRFDPVTVGANPQFNPFGTNNAPVVNSATSSYRAQLYYGSSTSMEDSLVPLTAAPALFRASTTTGEPGTWAPGNRVMNGFDTGDTVHLQVRVWDATYASSWDEYMQGRQGLAGKSGMFTYTIPIDPLGTPFLFNLFNFQGFTIGLPVPEPSTFLLSAVGVIVVLLYHFEKRRKQDCR